MVAVVCDTHFLGHSSSNIEYIEEAFFAVVSHNDDLERSVARIHRRRLLQHYLIRITSWQQRRQPRTMNTSP